MTDSEKIKILRKAIMVAVVELYEKHPKDILAAFSINELQHIANQTEVFRPRQVEDIYKEALKISAQRRKTHENKGKCQTLRSRDGRRRQS